MSEIDRNNVEFLVKLLQGRWQNCVLFVHRTICTQKKLVKFCFLFHFLTVSVSFLALCWKFSNGVVRKSFHMSKGTFRWIVCFSNEKFTFIVFGHWLEVFCNSHNEKSVVLPKLLFTCLKISFRQKRSGENVIFYWFSETER